MDLETSLVKWLLKINKKDRPQTKHSSRGMHAGKTPRLVRVTLTFSRPEKSAPAMRVLVKIFWLLVPLLFLFISWQISEILNKAIRSRPRFGFKTETIRSNHRDQSSHKTLTSKMIPSGPNMWKISVSHLSYTEVTPLANCHKSDSNLHYLENTATFICQTYHPLICL